jgi:hypothetical protein
MSVYHKNKSNKIEIDLDTQTLIIETLFNLPPESWLSKDLTKDQMYYWSDLNRIYVNLACLFEDYFNQRDSLERKWNLKKNQWQLLEAERDYYLCLYQLIEQGWQHIEQATESWDKFTFKSPGEALVNVIVYKCKECFNQCFKYHVNRMNEMYSLYREWRKLKQLLDYKQDLTSIEKNKIKRYKTKVKNLKKPMENYFLFEDFLVKICLFAAIDDLDLQRKYEDFIEQRELRYTLMMRRMPEFRGFAWDGKGNKIYTKPGGVYG